MPAKFGQSVLLLSLCCFPPLALAEEATTTTNFKGEVFSVKAASQFQRIELSITAGSSSTVKLISTEAFDGMRITRIAESKFGQGRPWLLVEVQTSTGHGWGRETYVFDSYDSQIKEILVAWTGDGDAAFENRYQLMAFRNDDSTYPRLKVVSDSKYLDYYSYDFATYSWDARTEKYSRSPISDRYTRMPIYDEAGVSQAHQYTISEDRINLRRGPGTTFPVVQLLRTKTFFNIVDCSDTATTENGITDYWYKVAIAKGKWSWGNYFENDVITGWIFGGYIYSDEKQVKSNI